ncbi:bifunctional diguanylate cyclase/phosphodiesterase [Pseudoduganella umbonata]|uniref:Diguanylate cyclase (GGDEF)-like protein n=1 Tax=Pseudoduganella umbonata TaxID=864828 RepID=A0A4P8HYX9_9BURK|nr:EAL domain-containing protein [Pseudoduganella umbonata]MBB3221965.1 diguanylate cyclase (GGDEF)-like protein [Pseudoduganella umbonata]QCP14242.1 EAL domain-containing protein [Pseudoduganella umbonata]
MDRPKSITLASRALRTTRATALPVFAWPFFGLVVACTCWVYLIQVLDAERLQFERSAYEAAARVAESQATQLSRDLTMIDQILVLVGSHWQAVGGRPEQRTLDEVIGPDKAILNIAVFSPDGAMLFTNSPATWPKQELDSVLRLPFFAEQKRNPADTMFIGPPRKVPGLEQYFIRFSRKILDVSGNLAGIVVIAFDSEEMIAPYDSAVLGRHGFVTSVGFDGTARAFRAVGEQRKLPPLPSSLRFALDSAAGNIYVAGRDFGDAFSRFISWKRVDGYPIVVVAAADQADAQAALNERRLASIRVAAGANLVLIVFVFIATMMSMRFHRERRELELSQAAYRKATEGGTEGFFICKPVHGGDSAIADYCVVDCNERGAGFLGSSRQAVTGVNLGELRGGLAAASFKPLLDTALRQGSAADDFQLDAGREREPQHLRVGAVESQGVLAVTVRDVTLEKSHMADLERRGNEDLLTGLPNRAWIRGYLPGMLERADGAGTKVAVLFVDLDGFKLVNDTFGHGAGDEVLQHVAKRLKVAVRPNDHVVRLGGDEFVVVLELVGNQSEAEHVAERILHAFHAPFSTSKGTASVGTSIGISLYPLDARDMEALYQHADLAMYQAKTSGKNRYHLFNPAFHEAMHQRTRREKELRAAIAENQFVLHYQSRVDCKSSKVTSLEALVRWNHPTEGLLGPDEFIGLAEETGLILNLGELVIDLVCAQIAQWAQGVYGRVPVSINVSSRQFNERDIRESIAGALARHGIEGSSVEIELTESSMVVDPRRTADNLQAIHALGVKLLVDDFGTGYSSLSMLHNMSFDVLKVDKSFTSRLGVDANGEVFFRAIITMAHSLGMRVVAEGVETAEQVRILEALQCDELQGFYLFRPVPADELPQSLELPVTELAAR